MEIAEALYEAIKHGDDEHKAWLKDKLDEFFSKYSHSKPFKDPGPWIFGFDDHIECGKRYYIESLSSSGEDFDDVRLYINGNMTAKQYHKYGYELATFLNTAEQPLDGCTRCDGAKGGIPGNENVIDGKLVCDYCS